MSQKIKNINGTEASPNGHGSWLQYWEKVTGQQAGACAELSCGKLASEGALAQKAGSHNEAWYIIPLCRRHSACPGSSIEVVGYIPMVEVEGISIKN